MILSTRAPERLRCGLAVIGITIVLTVSPRLCAAQSRPLTEASPADVLAGKEIFDAQCALCHGAAGAGGTGPDLRRPRLLHATNDEELVAVIRNGIPGTTMPFTFLSLSDPTIWQTAAYVRSLGRAEREPIKGNSQRGAVLYDGDKCSECHTVRGKGGTLGPDLSLIGVQRGTAALRQSLVDPAAEHASNYAVVKVTLKSGNEIRGIRLDEDVFWILLRDPSGRVHTLSKTTVVQMEREKKGTLMPSYQSLRDTDLDDLVAYLATLGGER
jgi:putative heme-binding domain-containing protein